MSYSKDAEAFQKGILELVIIYSYLLVQAD